MSTLNLEALQLKRNTAAGWVSENSVLASGEQGFETDTGKMKIGDGESAWNDLDYLKSSSPEVINFLNATGQGIITELQTQNSYFENLQGRLSALATNDKSNIVNAINELFGDMKTLRECTGAPIRNLFFRGKNLGNQFLNSQSEAIRAGTFDGLNLGDYWNINSLQWRIAHFDPFYGFGDCTAHHVAVVCDATLYMAFANSSNTTEGGIIGSQLRTTALENAKNTIKSIFGENHILQYNDFLSNGVTNGKATSAISCICDVEFMSEEMVTGTHLCGPIANIENQNTIKSYNSSQFALFRAKPEFIRAADSNCYWLRDIASSSHFLGIWENGSLMPLPAYSGNGAGVRPFFLLY